MRLLYNAALLPLLAGSWLYGVWPRSSEAKTLERDQRLARRLPQVPPNALWIHGASVGEARIVTALARAWRRAAPARPLAASAVTATGRALLPGPPDADAAFFLPLDFPGTQRRAFDVIRPSVVVLVETELWPNLLWEAAARAVPVALVNARLAPERFSRYRRLRSLYGPLVSSLALVATSSELEAERFRAFGLPGDRVRVTGNLKFDLPAPSVDGPTLRGRFGLATDRPFVVAGSTGAGEDPVVLDAFLLARREIPGLGLILAPRHPERFGTASAEALRRGLAVHRLSSGRDAAAGGADVLIADLLGELAGLYALGHASFVGGSLVPVGGHNLLEPVAAGSPPLFGPHTSHVSEIAEALVVSGAGERVADGPALARGWARLCRDAELRRRRVSIGRAIVEANRGAIDRTVDLLGALRERSAAGGGASA